VLRAQVRRVGDRVTCTGLRHWLRASPADEGGLRIEVAGRVDARWIRVDDDLGRVHRAALRLRLAAPEAAAQVADAAWTLVAAGESDPDPVGAIVRATYPLLTVRAGGRLPALPASLPAHLQPGFRTADPREAARRTFGPRATKPVVRALCGALDRVEVPDLFAVSVLAGAAEALEPDHVARLLADATTGPDAVVAQVLTPLTAAEVAGVAPLLAGVHPRRACRVLAAGLADDADRERLRFVVAERRAGGPTLADADRWEDLALLVALDADDDHGVDVAAAGLDAAGAHR
jgi:hypothetical protein